MGGWGVCGGANIVLAWQWQVDPGLEVLKLTERLLHLWLAGEIFAWIEFWTNTELKP